MKKNRLDANFSVAFEALESRTYLTGLAAADLAQVISNDLGIADSVVDLGRGDVVQEVEGVANSAASIFALPDVEVIEVGTNYMPLNGDISLNGKAEQGVAYLPNGGFAVSAGSADPFTGSIFTTPSLSFFDLSLIHI